MHADAVATTAAMSVGDGQARLPGIAVHAVSVSTASEPAVSSGKARSAQPGRASGNPKSQSLLLKSLVELGLLGPEHMARTVPMLQQLQSLLVKLGILESQSAASGNPKPQCPLVNLGRLGPEQVVVQAQPKWRQTRSLLVKLGLARSGLWEGPKSHAKKKVEVVNASGA